VVGMGLAFIFDPDFGRTGIICMAAGTMFGGILQWLILVPSLRRLGYRYYPELRLKDPALLEIGKLITPAMIGLSISPMMVFINSIFASNFQGGVTMLELAFRLVQLPIGIFGASISTAVLPSLAVEAAQSDRTVFRSRIEQALRLNATFCIPATCGLILFRSPLVSLLYQHGKFDGESAAITSNILIVYSIGLIAYSSLKILVSALYALHCVTTPLFISFGMIALTYFLNLLFVTTTDLGVVGLALTTSMTSIFGAIMLIFLLVRRIGDFSFGMFKAIGKIILASALMSGVLILFLLIMNHFGMQLNFFGNLVLVIGGIALGVVSFYGMIRILKLEEAFELGRIFQRF
jgi:putative peptidoglycan lipid II flippase